MCQHSTRDPLAPGTQAGGFSLSLLSSLMISLACLWEPLLLLHLHSLETLNMGATPGTPSLSGSLYQPFCLAHLHCFISESTQKPTEAFSTGDRPQSYHTCLVSKGNRNQRMEHSPNKDKTRYQYQETPQTQLQMPRPQYKSTSTNNQDNMLP